ncbi:protein of unknown function DUF214 [Solidesulfovibrio fructosivorans JJ]]|uniref:ABC3 transporter permease protein domain-containing protein n=1 Tax=Solidesulfovibrio fructosivorans JJ] TaxID=596151 RepID=E1K067_SOLFR|nr:FtsX-like permease family protein [Solidesulfovibrio fructosivorans]EFL49985.1 protein of unknown function DUF214 [Solidesulfovibrio fructosivorans JJ]]
MRFPKEIGLAFRLAGRELRAGFRGFGIFLACLALGVAAVAGVKSLAASYQAGLAEDAASLLGGDLEAALSQRPATAEERAALSRLGRVSHLVSMQIMARRETAAGPAARTLATLRAVDGAYPLYGSVELRPPMPLASALAVRDGRPGAVVAPELLSRLRLKVGDTILVADAAYAVRAVLERTPDAAGGLTALGPPLLVAASSLHAAGLDGPGSLTRHFYRLRLPAGESAKSAMAALRREFPMAGWRLRDAAAAQPGLTRFMDRLAAVTALVGLAALLLGGIGISQAVSGYLDGRTASIAAMKCLGAPRRLVVTTYLLVIAGQAACGIAVGLLVGALVPVALGPLLGALVPVRFPPGPYPGALALAGGCGALTALAFSLPQLAAAGRVPPLLLFRGYDAPDRPRLGLTARLPGLLCLAGLFALAVVSTPDRRLGLGFVVAAVAATALFWLFAGLAVFLAGRIPRRPGIRGLALRAISRPDNQVGRVLAALGLGLSTLCAMILVEANFRAAFTEDIPRTAPAFFFVDIQPDQLPSFLQTARSVPGVSRVETSPMARGRIAELRGAPVAEARVDPDARWAVQGDRGLTYAATMPEGTRIVAGSWWPKDYAGPPLVSVDEKIAAGLGLSLGDTVTVNALGREITATVASLRRINWLSLGINYVFVFSPGALDGIPMTWLATAYVDNKASGDPAEALFNAVTGRFANVTAIGTGDALNAVLGVADKVAAAVTVAAGTTLCIGMLVLLQTMAVGMRRKTYEAAIYKACGAKRRDILAVFLGENALLGTLAGCMALAIGGGLAWAFVAFFMDLPFRFFAVPALLTVATAAGVTLTLGMAGLWRALAGKAWPYLRNE